MEVRLWWTLYSRGQRNRLVHKSWTLNTVLEESLSSAKVRGPNAFLGEPRTVDLWALRCSEIEKEVPSPYPKAPNSLITHGSCLAQTLQLRRKGQVGLI